MHVRCKHHNWVIPMLRLNMPMANEPMSCSLPQSTYELVMNNTNLINTLTCNVGLITPILSPLLWEGAWEDCCGTNHIIDSDDLKRYSHYSYVLLLILQTPATALVCTCISLLIDLLIEGMHETNQSQKESSYMEMRLRRYSVTKFIHLALEFLFIANH